jgi:hypothetical protein
VKVMLQQLLNVARQRGSAVETCRDVARDIHCCLGDIDQVWQLLLMLIHRLIIWCVF